MKTNELKNFINNIRLVHLVLPISALIIIIFVLWQHNSGTLKMIKVKEEIVLTNLPQTYLQEEIIGNNKDIITCAINLNQIEDKEFLNYVSGEGIGKKVNFDIIVKKDGIYYRIKTIEGKRDEEKVYLTGYVKTKYLPDNYEILLYNKDSNKIYDYNGGTNEREM